MPHSRVARLSRYISGTSTATTIASIIMADAAPTPMRPRSNAKVYMKIEGVQVDVPGPPAVIATIRSNVLIARCARISSTEKKTGRSIGMMIRR